MAAGTCVGIVANPASGRDIRRLVAGASVFGDGRQHVLVADRHAELGVPLLVLWGGEDRIIPAEHARRVPDTAEVHVLQGSGHSPHMERAGTSTA